MPARPALGEISFGNLPNPVPYETLTPDVEGPLPLCRLPLGCRCR